jgi:type 1 glutamine amidotransferase
MIAYHQRPRSLSTLAAFVAVSLAMVSCASHRGGVAQGESAARLEPIPRRVLIVTGEGSYHRWQETMPVLAAALSKDPRLDVEVLDDLSAVRGEDLSEYAAVVLHFKNTDPAVPGRAGLDNLVRFVDNGGGLVLVHFACGAFEPFRDEYEQLIGRVWFGLTPPPGEYQHDPYGTFTVDIVDDEHPVSRGFGSFETTDELYTCLTGDVPIKVLATARSTRNGEQYPIAFVLEHESRRVFHCVLGHDAAALSNDRVGELYRRATVWAAGALPVVRHGNY